MNIVSLLPSATEVLYRLGEGDSIIGVSHDCDYPPEVLSKPIVSSTAVNDGLTSSQIDAAVGETYHRGESIYHLNASFLMKRKPDLIIAQELCQVCAVTSREARKAAEIARSGAQILSIEPSTLQEVKEGFLTLGVAVGREPEANNLANWFQSKIGNVSNSVSGISKQPKVFCIGWFDPLIVEGHWLPEMVSLAGARDGLSQPGEHSRRIPMQEVSAYGPEVIFLMPCSFNLERTMSEAHILAQLPGWADLPAVKSGRVYALDSSYFSRPGPRLAIGVDILARCLYPNLIKIPIPNNSAAHLGMGDDLSSKSFIPIQ